MLVLLVISAIKIMVMLFFFQDPKRHLEEHVDVLMTTNIVQCLGAMLHTVVFKWSYENEINVRIVFSSVCAEPTVTFTNKHDMYVSVLFIIFIGCFYSLESFYTQVTCVTDFQL